MALYKWEWQPYQYLGLPRNACLCFTEVIEIKVVLAQRFGFIARFLGLPLSQCRAWARDAKPIDQSSSGDLPPGPFGPQLGRDRGCLWYLWPVDFRRRLAMMARKSRGGTV
jgi:hypothetical protein